MSQKFDRSWTLFLDRDGVINVRLMGDYVKRTGSFVLLDGVAGAIRRASSVFGRIVVVTNQAGIGKGLMTEDELDNIHKNMVSLVGLAGGRIDGVYHCPNIPADNSLFRKPNTAMGYWAKREFPEIDFERSVMVGDSVSDMEFGKRLGMVTVFVGGTRESVAHLDVDYVLDGLRDFGKMITESVLV